LRDREVLAQCIVFAPMVVEEPGLEPRLAVVHEAIQALAQAR
jgi:hypothetical protein